MNRSRISLLLWVAATAITMVAAVYQRRIGPTTDLRGELSVGETTIHYVLKRSHGDLGDHEVVIPDPGSHMDGELTFKRYKTDDPWNVRPFRHSGDSLHAEIPRQPPGGKVSYIVTLWLKDAPEKHTTIPPNGSVIIRFRGPVPGAILACHILFIFMGMLWSNRTGLEALRFHGNPRTYAWKSLTLLFLGGLVFGPIVQWYSFGEFWTGVPLGIDLTDNKLLISAIAWIVALIRARRSNHERWYYLGASLVTFIAFSIPHSLLGTELDYT